MERSNSYAIIEEMIHQGEIRLSVLEHLLDALQREEHITTSEQESLLEFAWRLSIHNSFAADIL